MEAMKDCKAFIRRVNHVDKIKQDYDTTKTTIRESVLCGNFKKSY